MSTFDKRLVESGFTPIGLCSSLWIGRDGSFRGGFYTYQGRLHLILYVDADCYYINEVRRKTVEVCLRDRITLFALATECRSSMWWEMGKLREGTTLQRLKLWWLLQTNAYLLLPNYYYLWCEYTFNNSAILQNYL